MPQIPKIEVSVSAYDAKITTPKELIRYIKTLNLLHSH